MPEVKYINLTKHK